VTNENFELELSGAGHPLTVQSLKALVANERLDLIFFMETKNQEVVLNWVQNQLQFSNSVLMNPIGLTGGLPFFGMISLS